MCNKYQLPQSLSSFFQKLCSRIHARVGNNWSVSTLSPLEEHIKKYGNKSHFVGIIYRWLNTLHYPPNLNLRQKWEREVNLTITTEAWEDIWLNVKDASSSLSL